MGRCLITAPVARDLRTEAQTAGAPANIVRVPNGTNNVIQGWDSLDAAYWVALADAQLTIYTTAQSIPLAVRKYLIQFIRYNTSGGTTGAAWKRWQDCTASDFIKTNNGVKAVTALIAGDVPQEMDLMHHWFGNVQETLGSVNA